MSPSSAEDELTATICGAVQQLAQIQKAGVLLNIALTLIEDRQSLDEVDKCLDVYLKTPGLPKEGVAKALLARENARKLSGERLIAKERQVVQVPQGQLPYKELETTDLACQRVPPEIWEQIAVHVPRYHLRTWLFVSQSHREIASRHLFHTMDLHFGEYKDDFTRAVDIFDRAKNDPVFASRIRSLRLHWEITGDSDVRLDLIVRMWLDVFKAALPTFKALRDFEWIGYPEMQAEMVQVLFNTHNHLDGLGLILMGRDFHATSVSGFDKLHKLILILHGFPDMVEIRAVLDRNECTLKQLVLGGPLNPDLSWDLVFESATIKNLTHLHLVDTCVSNFVLTRIAFAHNLQSLTLQAGFVDPPSASVLFASDRIVNGSHTLLPHLEDFRFLLDDPTIYDPVIHFVRKREKLRRLDLCRCPWDLVQGILPDLRNLRVLGVRVKHLSEGAIKCLVESIPRQMVAIDLFVHVSDAPFDQYARYFTRFNTHSFLHFSVSVNKPEQTNKSLCSIAATIPSLDFLMWDFTPYVVVRPTDDGHMASVQLRELPIDRSLDYGSSVDFGSDDAAWLEQKDVPLQYQ